ncbi:hypothetical protein Tco_0671151, partial [Tanacetum coccineum]
SEVHTLENAIDHSVSNQDEPEIHNKVQPSNVIDTTSVHIGNSNVIPYEQYFLVNDISGIPSCASSALNSVCVLPVNDAFVPHDPIATELKIYKEQVYDQKTKTALGAQNPFYLRQAKKAQPALYDGDELLKPHHVPVTVSTSEEELELAEATRNKLHVKMNDFWPLTRNTPPKVLSRKTVPFIRATALKSDCMPADPQETIAPVFRMIRMSNRFTSSIIYNMANENVPSIFIVTTKTTSTLPPPPPPPPPPQQSTVHRDIWSVLTDSKVHIKMEVVSTCSSRVKFIATCSYSRLNDLTTSRENDLKLSQL